MRKVFLFLCLLQASLVFAAPIKVDVDRQTVNISESFQITFSTTEDIYDTPDFAPLEREFDIIDRDQSSSTAWVNGESSFLMKWTFTAMAKKAGKVVIPALQFGKETSPAVSLTVMEDKKKPDAVVNNEELFLEVAATPQQNYLQSQILYTVKVFTRVGIAKAELSEPVCADAMVTKLGGEKQYQTQVGGITYQVVEGSYAIFPQKSGRLRIEPLVLTAEILDSGADSFALPTSHTKRVTSKAVNLTVLPVPADFKGHWLAAQALELKQQWSGDVQTMKVGEPVTRTITLIAKGAASGQLPKLNQTADSDSLKSYPDQPHLEEQKNPEGIVAVREEKIAYIVHKEGSYPLMAVEIPWFNINTGKIEIATIPAVTLKATALNKPSEEQTEEKMPVKKQPMAAKSKAVTEVLAVFIKTHLWLAVVVCFVLGLLIVMFFFYQRVQIIKKKTAHESEDIDYKNNIVQLRKACANNNAMAAKDALIVWGKYKYNAATLGAIAEFCDDRLKDEILRLNLVLYGQHKQEWDGRKLFRVFNDYSEKGKSKQKQDDKLEPLHRL